MTTPNNMINLSKLSSNLKGMSRFFAGELQKRPRTLYIEVTMRCNARCDFCSYWRLPKMKELPDYQDVVETLHPLTVIITGGEPMVRKDLPQIISGIKAAKPLVISMLTNGRLLTIEKARELRAAGLDTISVSLNHMGAAQDEERHLPGLFDHLQNLMPRLSDIGFKRVNVNTVFLDDNLDEIVRIIQLVRRWGVGISFSCYSADKADNHNYEISPDKLGELDELLSSIHLHKLYGSHVENSSWYLSKVPEFYRTGRVIGKCPAGRQTLHITPDGYVKPCPDFPVIAHYTKYNTRRSSQVNCNKCWYACRGELEAPITPSRALYFLKLWLKKNSDYETETTPTDSSSPAKKTQSEHTTMVSR